MDGTTAPPQGRQVDEAPPPRFSGTASSVVWVVVGAAAGGMFVWALLAGDLGAAATWLNSVLDLVLAGLAGFGAAVVLAVPLAWWWLVRFVGTARGTLKQVVSDAAAATRAAAENDAGAAASYAERTLHEAAAWYGPIAARRFVVQTALALLVTFGGLVGTGLLFRQTLLLGEQNQKLQEQTALLQDQNAKLDLQTVTAEAQRRAGLAGELFSILQAATAQEIPETEASETGVRQLHRGLRARTVAFSRAAQPYWTAEVPTESGGLSPTPRLGDRPRSPERGQLLVGLVVAGFDIPALIKEGATFDYADLRGAGLNGVYLRGVTLLHADLRGAFLHGADLRGTTLLGTDMRAGLSEANLREATLFGVDLRGAGLLEADLRRAKLGGANLREADLRGANLGDAVLHRADLREADLGGADLRGAKLGGTPNGGANLHKAFLANAKLNSADLGGANLSETSLFGADLSGADLRGTDLRRAVLLDLQGTELGEGFEGSLPGANLSDAVVGSRLTPGQLPEDFPKGWDAPPVGWELFERDGLVRLRRIDVPPAASPLPPQKAG